jgi:hypothetical protein
MVSSPTSHRYGSGVGAMFEKTAEGNVLVSASYPMSSRLSIFMPLKSRLPPFGGSR